MEQSQNPQAGFVIATQMQRRIVVDFTGGFPIEAAARPVVEFVDCRFDESNDGLALR